MCVADIKIRFIVESNFIASFLKEKYNDYLVESSRALYEIKVHENGHNLWKKNGKKYSLEVIDFKNNFAYFNDLFLQVFNDILSENRGFIFHASSLVFEDKGYIFMGREGAGKSTVRKLVKKIESLGDDVAIIKKRYNEFYLYGSPFYQRTKRSYENKKVKIEAIFNIIQSGFTMIENIDDFSSLETLRRNIFLSKNEKVQNETLFNFFHSNKVLKMYFEMSDEFWMMITSNDFKFLFKKNYKDFIKNIEEGLNIKNSLSLKPILVNQKYIDQLHIVNELSWNFEFSGLRKVKDIVYFIVTQNKSSGVHKKIIKNIDLKKNDKPIIIMKRNGIDEIIDGNHRTIAKSLKKHKIYKALYAN